MEIVKTIEPVTADAAEQAFVSRVELLENGCWLWHGVFNPIVPGTKKRNPRLFIHEGAGRRGKNVNAQAYAYQKRVGEIPCSKTFVRTNSCGLDLCVNPIHLEFVARSAFNANQVKEMHAGNKNKETCRKGLHPWTAENIVFRGKNKLATCRFCAQDKRRQRTISDRSKSKSGIARY